MSSWKKASKVNQKVHRERHQPSSREHLGLLEKKKDYKFRANDYNKKKKILKLLRKHALDRNPDEYYFHMINSKLVDGKHTEKRKPDSEDSLEQKKLMENKNLNYVNMKKTIETKKIEKLKSELHMTDLAKITSRTHIYFDENNVSNSGSSEMTEDLDTKIKLPDINKNVLKKINKKKEKSYEHLAKRIQREKELNVVHRKMEINHALKDSKMPPPIKLLKNGTKSEAPVYVWTYQRKR